MCPHCGPQGIPPREVHHSALGMFIPQPLITLLSLELRIEEDGVCTLRVEVCYTCSYDIQPVNLCASTAHTPGNYGVR